MKNTTDKNRGSAEPIVNPKDRKKQPWAARESDDEATAAQQGDLGGGKRAQEKELKSRP